MRSQLQTQENWNLDQQTTMSLCNIYIYNIYVKTCGCKRPVINLINICDVCCRYIFILSFILHAVVGTWPEGFIVVKLMQNILPNNYLMFNYKQNLFLVVYGAIIEVGSKASIIRNMKDDKKEDCSEKLASNNHRVQPHVGSQIWYFHCFHSTNIKGLNGIYCLVHN